MISTTKPSVPAWRLPRAGTCGVPEADAFFAAFDGMCEVLEKFAGEIPANYRAQIETACVDFVTMNEKMGISPFCVLNFRGYIDSIIKHRLYDFTEEERNKLCDMGLLDYRYLFEQMVSVYVDKEVIDEINRFRESEALLLLGEAEARPKWEPEMLPTIESDDADGWHRAVGRLINSLMDAYSDTGLPLPLVAAVTHLKETASGTIFGVSGVYTRKRLADVLSKRDGISVMEAEARIKRWEEAGHIGRIDYQGILNAWDDSDFFYLMEEREDDAVCDAVRLEWKKLVDAGLIGNSLTEPGDGLAI